MSLTNPQKALLKRAQAEAGLEDEEYRSALETLSALPACRSSTDPRLTDRHLDNLMSYFEAIFWRKVDLHDWHLHCPSSARPVFQSRDFWASRNRAGNTSRDRYVETDLTAQIRAVETRLNELGFGPAYVAAIRSNIQPYAPAKYLGALNRTLKSKCKPVSEPVQPF